ncbi:hypothetical protein D3C73_958280 [compost metagenome]
MAGRGVHHVPTIVPRQVLRLAISLDLGFRTTLVPEVLVRRWDFRGTEDVRQVVPFHLQRPEHDRDVEVHVPEGHEVRLPFVALVDTLFDHGPRGLHDLDLELDPPWLDDVTQVLVQRRLDGVDRVRDVLDPGLQDRHDGLLLEGHGGDNDVLAPVLVPHVGLGIEHGHLVGTEETRPLLLVLALDQGRRTDVSPVDVLVAAQRL